MKLRLDNSGGLHGQIARIIRKRIGEDIEKSGFEEVRQKGSHVSLRKGTYKTVVPLHDELAIGTTMAILRQSGLDREDIEKLR